MLAPCLILILVIIINIDSDTDGYQYPAGTRESGLGRKQTFIKLLIAHPFQFLIIPTWSELKQTIT